MKIERYDEERPREDLTFDIRIKESWGVVDECMEEIVPIKYSKQLPDEFENVIVESSTSHLKGVIDAYGKEKIPAIYEHLFRLEDVFVFGFGGYESKDYNFFSSIKEAQWGCISMDGQIIVPPLYECIKVKDNFIIAGRQGLMVGYINSHGEYIENGYDGRYDLYEKNGKLIFGGFNSFIYDADNNLFQFNFISNDRYDNWLVTNSDLMSIKKDDNGDRLILNKGYIIEEFDENALPLCITNELYTPKRPIRLFNFLYVKDSLTRIEDGYTIENERILPIGQDLYCYSYGFDMWGDYRVRVGINKLYFKDGTKEISEDEIFSPMLDDISIITYPRNGYMFAVTERANDFCTVELFNVNEESRGITAISSIHKYDIITGIAEGDLRIKINHEEEGLKQIQLPNLSIFDEKFRKMVSDNEYSTDYKNEPFKYWFAADEEDFQHHIYHDKKEDDDDDAGYDYDSSEESWYAMTDGTYGDYPDDFDGDYDFLGN